MSDSGRDILDDMANAIGLRFVSDLKRLTFEMRKELFSSMNLTLYSDKNLTDAKQYLGIS